MCGWLLYSAPTGTAPALQAVRAVSDGEETPKEKRWWRQAWRSSTPLCFPSTRACLCQNRPFSPPPLGGVKVKSTDSFQHLRLNYRLKWPSETFFLAISASKMPTWLDMLPDVAVGQCPALFQQQKSLWAELHVQISAISSVDMGQKRRLAQVFHSGWMKQRHWHLGTILQREAGNWIGYFEG